MTLNSNAKDAVWRQDHGLLTQSQWFTNHPFPSYLHPVGTGETEVKGRNVMIGLVLWSDDAENKAVFWCEDHGDLAFFDSAGDPGTPPVDLQPGDMVRFDVINQQDFRSAQNVELLSKRVAHALPDRLLRSASDEKTAMPQESHPTVVSFRRGAAQGGAGRVRKTG